MLPGDLPVGDDRAPVRRVLLVWLLLFGCYAAALGIAERGGSRLSDREAHVLLVARSIERDGDLDVANQYATHQDRLIVARGLRPLGVETNGHANEPVGAGLPLLVAPAYAAGGATLAELWIAALAALAFALAVPLARRIVPDPWATAAPLCCGLSAPVVAAATAVDPMLPAAAALTGAALLALKVRARPRLRWALPAALLLGMLPWLAPQLVLPGAVIGVALVRWLLRRNRRFQALVAGEAMLFSVVVYVSVNDRIYGGITPEAASAPHVHATGITDAGDVVHRIPRILGLLIDRHDGLLRWAPIFALAGVALWLLARSRRERLSRALPGQLDVEVAAGLLAAAIAVQVVVAIVFAPNVHGPGLGPRHLLPVLGLAAPLVAWGLRHARRTGMVLAVLTLAITAWLLIALHTGSGSWSDPPSQIPLGPLHVVLPTLD